MPIKNIVTDQAVPPIKAFRAKDLRSSMTRAESILWAHLRNSQMEGFHFRRQQVIEPYIVDFYCHQAELVIEVDGGIHLEQEESDRLRQEDLEAHGLRVLRFTNLDVEKNLEAVLEMILEACEEGRATFKR